MAKKKDIHRKLKSFVLLQIVIELLWETSKSVLSLKGKNQVSLRAFPFYLGQLDCVLLISALFPVLF